MTLNIGNKLKLRPTNDAKVSDFVRNYSDIHTYIESVYQDTTQPLILKDLLLSLLSNHTISYSNLPVDSTFTWYLDGVLIPESSAYVKDGSTVTYSLVYSNGSKSVGEFVVDSDFNLDLSTLTPNRFNLTITANKELDVVRVYHNYTTGSTNYITLPKTQNNIYVIECDKNENIRVCVGAKGWAETDKTPWTINIVNNPHDYWWLIKLVKL